MMKRVRKRGMGRRAQVAESSASKPGTSKATSSKKVSTRTGKAKARLLKKRAPQVTSKAREKEPRSPGTRAAAAGVVETALAVFAHEVRTPLTGILAISDLLATSELGERERRWVDTIKAGAEHRSEEHTSELQSHVNLVCRLLLEKKKKKQSHNRN